MTMVSAIPVGAVDAYAQLLAGLEHEYGCGDVAALADRIVGAERVDFLWQARVAERYLGQYVGLEFAVDDPQDELARMAIVSFLAGRWHVGVCLIDGEGTPADLLWDIEYLDGADAEIAFETAH